jgi:hypothetical protein
MKFFKSAMLSIAVATSFSVLADDHKKSGTSAVEVSYLASSLAQMGIDAKNPVMLAAAAMLKQQAEAAAEEAKFEMESSDQGTPKNKSTGTRLSAEQLFSEAQKYAGSQSLSQAIEVAMNTKSRGAVGGSKHKEERVNSNSSDRYRLEFRGGETAQVLVDGDGDTDLDLYIYDENGNEVCTDLDITDTMYCKWRPRLTGNFVIEIKNLGDVYNVYDIYTN